MTVPSKTQYKSDNKRIKQGRDWLTLYEISSGGREAAAEEAEEEDLKEGEGDFINPFNQSKVQKGAAYRHLWYADMPDMPAQNYLAKKSRGSLKDNIG